MATARCSSINFSYISSSCFSALRGFSLRGCFNFGDCFKSSGGGKLSEVESESLGASSLGGDSFDAAADDLNNNSPPAPILLEPGSFFPSALNLENQNPRSIWINSVSVSPPQDNDLSNDPDKNISQNLTHYNVPVPIIEERNANEYTKIQSILVQNADEEMSQLVKSHMDEFSKLMSLVEGDASYESRLLTPMRKFDELTSRGDSEYEATDLTFTPIDGNNLLEDGVVLTMPTPIREEVLDKNLGAIYNSLPRVLQVNKAKNPLQPFFEEIPYKQRELLSSSDEFPVDGDSDDGRSSGKMVKVPTDDLFGGGTSRMGSFKRANATDQRPTEISDKELREFQNAYEEGKTKQPEPTIRSSEINEATWYEMFSPEKLGEFFGNSSEKVSSHDFFEKLSDFVNKIKEKVVPSPAPASARVESDSRNGKGK